MAAKGRKVLSKQARDARTLLGEAINARVEEERLRTGKSLSATRRQIGQDAGGLSISTMRRLEEGTVATTLDTLASLAHRFGCTVADLTGNAPLPEPPKQRRRRRLDPPEDVVSLLRSRTP